MQNIIFNIVAKTKEFIDGMRNAGNETDKTKQKVSELNQVMNKMAQSIAGTFAVSQIISFGKEMVKVGAIFDNLTIRVNSLAGGIEAGAVKMEELRQMSVKLGIDLKTLTENYINFVAAATSSGMKLGVAEKAFKSMNMAMAGSGVSAQTQTQVFQSLQMMIGKTSVSSMQLKQIFMAMPESMKVMADTIGVTTNELNKMLKSGEVMVGDILPKFAENMEIALGGDAQKMAESLQGKLANLENAWDNLYRTTANTGMAGGAISALTTLVGVLENAIIGAGVVMGALLAPFDGGDYLSDFIDKIETRELNKYIAELKATEEQRAEEYIQILKKQGMTEKEIRAELLEIADEEERRATNIATINRKLTEDEVNRIRQKVERMKAYRKAAEELIPTKEETKKLSEAELKALEKQREAVKNLRRQVQLLQADETSRIRIKAQDDISDLKSSPVFKELNPQEQQILIDNIQNTAQAQIDAIIETRTKNEQKAQDALKKLFEFTPKTRQEIQDANTPTMPDEYKKALEEKYEAERLEVEQVKEIEQQKKDIRLDMAMQTFSLLSNLNASYSQSQTRALQEQLKQGVISQEAYEAQLRKIKRKQAIIDKAGALFQIGLNTAQGISSASATVAGLPLVPFIAGLGALQAATVIASPIPYNKGTKRVPMIRGAVRGKDSVHAILTPDERVVPADINTMQGYSALMDLAQDRKISDAEAGVIAQIATGGRIGGNNKASNSIDYDLLGKSIAKYIPHTDVSISDKGIAVISERRRNEISRLQSKL